MLDEAELMPLWVGHHDHDAHVVVVPLVGPPSTYLLDLAAADVMSSTWTSRCSRTFAVLGSGTA